MIIAMMISPFITIFGSRGWTRWLLARRRSFGLAAFGYGVLHLIFYVVDMEELQPILAEFFAPGIWTGWAALFLFLPLAITSNDASMRWLKKRWKLIQRLVYGAALLTLAHWLLIHDGAKGALVHFVPLLILQLLRMIIIYGRAKNNEKETDSPLTQ